MATWKSGRLERCPDWKTSPIESGQAGFRRRVGTGALKRSRLTNLRITATPKAGKN